MTTPNDRSARDLNRPETWTYRSKQRCFFLHTVFSVDLKTNPNLCEAWHLPVKAGFSIVLVFVDRDQQSDRVQQIVCHNPKANGQLSTCNIPVDVRVLINLGLLLWRQWLDCGQTCDMLAAAWSFHREQCSSHFLPYVVQGCISPFTTLKSCCWLPLALLGRPYQLWR